MFLKYNDKQELRRKVLCKKSANTSSKSQSFRKIISVTRRVGLVKQIINRMIRKEENNDKATLDCTYVGDSW